MNELRARVEALVAQIPKGKVMTYGQLAALCGSPRAARIVGGIAHYGPTYHHTTPDCPSAKRMAPQKFVAQPVVEPSSAHSSYRKYNSLRSSGSPSAASTCDGCGGVELPWQRVVNKQGGLASGYPGGKAGHKTHLEAEGVVVSDDYQIDIEVHIWNP